MLGLQRAIYPSLCSLFDMKGFITRHSSKQQLLQALRFFRCRNYVRCFHPRYPSYSKFRQEAVQYIMSYTYLFRSKLFGYSSSKSSTFNAHVLSSDAPMFPSIESANLTLELCWPSSERSPVGGFTDRRPRRKLEIRIEWILGGNE